MKYLIAFLFSINLWSQDYFNVELKSNWSDESIIKGPENVRYSDLWGFKYNNSKYAVIGSTEGSHFLKIDASDIVEVQFFEGAFSSPLVQHRDYKRYKNYIYAVCDEGNSTLQIFDISHLPDSVQKVYDSNEHFTICHNIFIDTLNAKLYACGPDNIGMKILDISNPELPALFMNFTNLNYVHDCFVKNDTAFLNAGIDGLRIYDFSNSNIAIELGTLSSYQEKGYNHSGWMDETDSYYCFVDETLGKRIKFCELDKGLENIEVDALFGTRQSSEFIAHNIILHNGYAFVSYYNEGFRIFDLLEKPIKQVGYFDTYNEASSYKLNGAWGVFVFEDDQTIIISDRQAGLFHFHFPFRMFRALTNSHQVFGTPFINESTQVIIDPLNSEILFFDIYTIAGGKVYNHQLVQNWLNIPLHLAAGQYIYHVYSENNKVNYSGKFSIIR